MDMREWTCDANESLKITLVNPDNVASPSFHPCFTYPIFGEKEKIYGYKDLIIDLRCTAGSLYQYLSISFSEKLSSTTVDDVEAKLSRFLPADVLRDEVAFKIQLAEDVLFKPPGQLIHSFTHTPPAKGAASTSKDSTYEIYHAKWDTPGFKEYHRRMQLFIILYIEGGSYIQEDEDSWEFVVMYERQIRPHSTSPAYCFVGYSTLYPFYCYPEKVRLRLSQFVIIPPYQRKGLGSALYTAIYNYVLKSENVSELTVEDPAEAFEDLRDRNDLRMLLNLHAFIDEGFGTELSAGGPVRNTKGKGKAVVSKGKMGPPADKAWAETWRKKLKIAGRQFQRLVEMLQLLRLEPTDARAQKAYRLQVKERLYRFNYEVLVQLDKQERLDKLEETFQSVCGDYKRILAMSL